MVVEIREVGRALIMEGFVSKKKDFELDAVWNGEPVEVLENTHKCVVVFLAH